MFPLRKLPDFILEDVLSYTLSLQPASTCLTRQPQVVLRGGKVVKKIAALPLLLSCRLFNDVVTSLVLSRATFRLWDKECLRAILDIIPPSRLPRLKNVSLTLGHGIHELPRIYSLEDSENEVEECTELMSRLPEGLHRLQIDLHDARMPAFTMHKQSHPSLQRSLWRFKDLQEINIDAGEHYFHVELFTAVRFDKPWYLVPHDTNFKQYYKENKPIPWDTFEKKMFTPPRPAPMFPKLTRLTITGNIASSVTPAIMTNALSEKHLPSLTHLVINGLIWDEFPEGMDPPSWVFSPECLRAMHPLTEFSWATVDSEEMTKETFGNPHIPPMKAHLTALRERHGATLCWLKIIYDGWMYEFEEEDEENLNAVDPRSIEWDEVLDEMPNLRNVQILCTECDVRIETGMAYAEQR